MTSRGPPESLYTDVEDVRQSEQIERSSKILIGSPQRWTIRQANTSTPMHPLLKISILFLITIGFANAQTASSGNFIDSAGLEWMRCPLLADSTSSCSQNRRLTYFEAVEATARLGKGWRLPEIKDYRNLASDLDRRLIARGAGNLRCGEYIFGEIATVMAIRGIIWSAKFYTSSDESGYRTNELMADAIAMEQVPNCRYFGGAYPVYGFNAERVGNRYLTYAVKDPAPTMNATWERTARLILTEREKLVQQNEIERENENQRTREDEARLFEWLRSAGGQTSSSDPVAFTVIKRWSGGVNGVREQSYVRCDSGRKRGEEFKAWLHDSGYWSSPGNTSTYKTLHEVMNSACS